MNGIADFTDRKVLVAGASSGIGKKTALVLSRLGAKLILVARREDKLKETLELLEGDGHSYYLCDLSQPETIESLVKTVVSEQGKLDGLVYAAGVNTSMPLGQFKPEKVQQVFNINYFGFIEFVRQVCRRGRFNEGMRIVGVSSVASVRGDKSHLAYSGSKAAMNASIRCIAKEVADKGICINAVAPAMTKTEMYTQYVNEYGEDSGSNDDLLKRQYLGLAETDDIANAIAFLMSPAARFITGITLPVDGGLTTS
ncbi:MAG: SDR family oxidoreductase [Oscillospiraceae bacterium]|nr:SDR family oxidoreductase [Oscillospiraceae bacterium]